MTPQEELHELMELAVMQGRIEGVTAAVNTLGGFIDLVEDGSVGEDWLAMLRHLRNGMCDVVLRSQYDIEEKLTRGTG